MRFRLIFLLILGLPLCLVGDVIEDFIAAARQKQGPMGERAARFLADNMPPADRGSLSLEFLNENLDLAFQARTRFPWAKKVPEDIFFNDVLPYAVFDEKRDSWRTDLLKRASEIIKDSKTASEAAQSLNRQLFKQVNIHYNTGRKRPNQSLMESMESGKATCTGLSIILVEACRAVGIPARAVGTPLWTNERGNHTWVEIWDGDWHFTGADEFDANGLDRGWFVADASTAKADIPRHAIYATSWKRTGVAFPMVWAQKSESVAAVNVTGHYAKTAVAEETVARLGVRLWERTGGTRMAAKVCVMDGVRRTCALADTKAGTSDLNDMPRFALKLGARGWLRFTVGSEIRERPFGPLLTTDPTLDASWADLSPASPKVDAVRAWLEKPEGEQKITDPALVASLSHSEADRVVQMLLADRLARLAIERKEEMSQRVLSENGQSLKWLEKAFGNEPTNGHSLWISMHGGGGAPAEVNDQQWRNQIKLYEPVEGIYLAPRAPTDTWNLWHEGHIDPLFQRLIDNYVALRGVNPSRVYLMGYSAGGDGVWQLAPRMADRFAAACMMAGHPNEASLLSLRNLPFAIFMGGNDTAYRRNIIAAERGAELDRLAANDPGGYPHQVHIYEGLGHWMNKKDSEGVPWMAAQVRNSWPAKLVWQQDDVVHRRFYWLQVPKGVAIADRSKLVATVVGQSIQIDGEAPALLQVRLSDRLLNLDKSVSLEVNGRKIFSGTVLRQAAVIRDSLEERADADTVATAIVRGD